MDKVHVLVIDDSEVDLLFVRRAFRDQKHRVQIHTELGGQAGLDFLQSASVRPDLILLDLNMPGMDGYEVLQTLKEDASLRRIPVVIFSTSSAEQHVERAYDAHANSYVTKPSDLDGLTQALSVLQQFWLEVAERPAS